MTTTGISNVSRRDFIKGVIAAGAAVSTTAYLFRTSILGQLKKEGACAGHGAGMIRPRPEGILSAHTRIDGLGFLDAFLSQAIEQRGRRGEWRATPLLRTCPQPFAATRGEGAGARDWFIAGKAG